MNKCLQCGGELPPNVPLPTGHLPPPMTSCPDCMIANLCGGWTFGISDEERDRYPSFTLEELARVLVEMRTIPPDGGLGREDVLRLLVTLQETFDMVEFLNDGRRRSGLASLEPQGKR